MGELASFLSHSAMDLDWWPAVASAVGRSSWRSCCFRSSLLAGRVLAVDEQLQTVAPGSPPRSTAEDEYYYARQQGYYAQQQQ